jgi:hypothetical protein
MYFYRTEQQSANSVGTSLSPQQDRQEAGSELSMSNLSDTESDENGYVLTNSLCTASTVCNI